MCLVQGLNNSQCASEYTSHYAKLKKHRTSACMKPYFLKNRIAFKNVNNTAVT